MSSEKDNTQQNPYHDNPVPDSEAEFQIDLQDTHITFSEWETSSATTKTIDTGSSEFLAKPKLDLLLRKLQQERTSEIINFPGLINTLLETGMAYSHLHDYEKSQKYLEEAQNHCETILSTKGENEDVINIPALYTVIVFVRGSNFKKQGELEKAKICLNHSLELQEARRPHLPTEDKAVCLYLLGSIFQSEGDLSKAVEYLSQSLTMEKTLFKNQPTLRTSFILNDLQSIYNRLGETAQASEYEAEFLNVMRSLKQEKPDLNYRQKFKEVADTYFQNKNFDEAVRYYKAALHIEEEILQGASSFNQAAIYQNLGQIYQQLNEIEESLTYYKSALAMLNDLGEEESTLTKAALLENMGAVYHGSKKFELALKYYKDSYEMRISIEVDENNINIATLLENIGDIYYYEQKNLDEALKCYLQTLAILDKTEEEDILYSQAFLLNKIGEVYKDKKEFDQSLKSGERALELSKFLNSSFLEVIALNHIGEVHQAQGNFDIALNFFNDCFSIEENLNPGQNAIVKPHTYSNLGETFKALGNSVKALYCFNMTLTFMKENPSEECNINISDIETKIANLETSAASSLSPAYHGEEIKETGTDFKDLEKNTEQLSSLENTNNSGTFNTQPDFGEFANAEPYMLSGYAACHYL